jgi:Ser-tRNA(Ala) deacylase AlaX
VYRQCHKRHHTLLHIDKQNQVANANRHATNNNSPAATRDATTVEVNSYQSLKDKPRNNILLATAVV